MNKKTSPQQKKQNDFILNLEDDEKNFLIAKSLGIATILWSARKGLLKNLLKSRLLRVVITAATFAYLGNRFANFKEKNNK